MASRIIKPKLEDNLEWEEDIFIAGSGSVQHHVYKFVIAGGKNLLDEVRFHPSLNGIGDQDRQYNPQVNLFFSYAKLQKLPSVINHWSNDFDFLGLNIPSQYTLFVERLWFTSGSVAYGEKNEWDISEEYGYDCVTSKKTQKARYLRRNLPVLIKILPRNEEIQRSRTGIQNLVNRLNGGK